MSPTIESNMGDFMQQYRRHFPLFSLGPNPHTRSFLTDHVSSVPLQSSIFTMYPRKTSTEASVLKFLYKTTSCKGNSYDKNMCPLYHREKVRLYAKEINGAEAWAVCVMSLDLLSSVSVKALNLFD